jgi:hypothetical protein
MPGICVVAIPLITPVIIPESELETTKVPSANFSSSIFFL